MTAPRTELLRRTAGTVALVAAGVALAFPGTAGAAPCASSGPASGAYAVTVCVSAPSDGATVSGDTTASATASVTGANPGIQRVVFYLDDQYLLTDYEPPYTFELPAGRFVDGTRTLSAETLMRDGFVSSRGSVSLTFSNGVASPPAAGTGFVPRVGTPAAAGMPFVVGAAGDGASGETSAENVSDEILSWDPNLFLYLGDVYEKGTETEFRNWYGGPTRFWGRLAALTNPVLGDHEDSAGEGAPGYDAYWGTPPRYFSYDAAGWHLIQLNTLSSFGQVTPGTPQYDWLLADLAANSAACTLVYFHDPVFSVGAQGDSPELAQLWSQLVISGVDLVLTANDHNYQRWLPLNVVGAFDPSGVTQFVVGSGGHGIRPFSRTDARLAAGFDTSPGAFGALRLQLNVDGAGYQFVGTSGAILDSGTVRCSGTGADTLPPAAPTELVASASAPSQVDLQWTAATDNVGVASYDVLRDDAVLTTIGPDTSYADTSAAPATTYTYRLRARDGEGNVSELSEEVSVTTPPRTALFADDFESGDLSKWNVVSGLVVDTAHAFSGSHSARATTTGAVAYARKRLVTGQSELFVELNFKVHSQGSNSFNLFRLRKLSSGTGGQLLKAYLSSTGRLAYRNEVASVARTSALVPSRGSWHRLEVHVKIAGTEGLVETFLDGVAVPALTRTESLGTAAIGQLDLGNSSAVTADASFDDVVLDGNRTLDTSPPSTPQNVAADVLSGLAVRLTWNASFDNVGVVGYDVYRGSTQLASLGATSLSYTDSSASPHSSYSYTVRARDGAGNQSLPSSPASVETPEIFSSGFESGDFAGWSSVTGMSIQSTDVFTGSFAAEAASASPSYAYRQLERGLADVWFRARLKIVSQGPSSVNLLQFRGETGAAIATVFATSTGRLSTRNEATGANTQSAVTLTPGRWYDLQAHAVVNGAAGSLEVRLDGGTVAELTKAEDLGTLLLRRLVIGDTSVDRAFVVRYDDIVADDRPGADSTAPTAPTGLAATTPSTLRVVLAWTAAFDAGGVAATDVYRDGVLVGSAPGSATSFTDVTATPGAAYSYTLRARDAAGNVGPASAPRAVTAATGLLFFDGFESGGMALWNSVTSVTVQAGEVSSGAFAARSQSTGAPSYAYKTLAADETEVELRVRFKLAAQTDSTNVVKLRTATGGSLASVSVSDFMKVSLRNDLAGVTTASTTSIAPGWHDLQVRLVAAGAAGVIEVYFDNALVGELSGTHETGTAGVRRIEIGDRDSGDSWELFLDDVAVAGRAEVDRDTPTVPTGMAASAAQTGLAVELSWSASSDAVGVTGYDLYRNGALLASLGAVTSTTDATAEPNTSYSYQVAARDAAGHVSALSGPATVATGPVFADGFESGDLSRWTSATGMAVAPEHASAGSFGALATSTGAAARAFRQLPRGLNDVYARLRFKPISQGANSVNLIRFRTGTGGAILSVFVTSTGKVGIRNDVTGVTTLSTVGMTPGAWNELQARAFVNGASGQVQVWLDGGEIAALNRTEDLGTNPVQRLEIFDSSTGRSFSFAGDEFRAETSQIPESAPPTPPTNVSVAFPSALRAEVTWAASADASGVAGYDVYRDGALVGGVTGTSFVDVRFTPGSTATYTVKARDAAGNVSAPSTPFAATGPAALIFDGFESGLADWTNDGLFVQDLNPFSGSFAARGSSTGAATWAYRDLVPERPELDVRLVFDVESSSTSLNLLKLRATPTSSGSSGTIFTLYYSSSGKLGIWNEVTGVSTTSSVEPGPGWHTAQVHFLLGDPNGLVEVWLDGRPVAELTGAQALGTRAVGRLQIGENSTGKTYLFDLDDLYLDPRIGG